MSQVRELITKRFFEHYGAPKDHPNLDAYVAEYERALAGTESALLRDAASLAIDRQTYPIWPTVGAVKQAVETIATQRNLARERQGWGKSAEALGPEPTAESQERVDAMMRQTIANLKKIGPKPANAQSLPDVSRPAWEAMFGASAAQPRARIYPYERGSGLRDVSRDAWEKRFGKPAPEEPEGYKGGEIDRRFKEET